MTFADDLSRALKYGAAPLGDVQDFIKQAVEERNDESYTGGPEPSLTILRDYLDDADDPRLAVMERHLEHKRAAQETGNHWLNELEGDLMRRLGLPETERKWNHFSTGIPYQTLPDRSTLEVERFANAGTGAAANRVRWRIPDKEKGQSYDGDYPISANMTDEETNDLLSKLGVDKRVGQSNAESASS